jgi:hypothetical protein
MGSPFVLTVLLAAALTARSGAIARAEPIPPERPPPAVLELRNLMSGAEYRTAGLEKLSAQELEALDDWIGRLVVRLLTDRKQAGCSSPVDSRVDGEFEGWTGRTVVQLENGQIWKQRSAAEAYAYRVAPRVQVHRTAAGCHMKVDGVEGEMLVERLR